MHNPAGLGATDLLELALAALLVALVVPARSPAAGYWQRLAQKPRWCMLLLFLLPVALRLALLPHYPVPTPGVSDDFSYVLLADTLRHFRLANPAHPLPQFFETFFVVQQPTYSSIFPLGQGLVLAAGWIVCGNPWAGVALSIGAFCALCYWMLRGWTTPGWSLLGGVLAVIQFGPLNQWMNSFWGGGVSAAAGCLVFGSLPRLRDGGRSRYAVCLGAGLAAQLLTRPFEFLFLAAGAILFFAPVLWEGAPWRSLAKAALVSLLLVLPAGGLMLLQNRSVTGSWTKMPYMLSREQYGVPTTFTFQPNPVPHREMTAEQRLDYEIQSKVHGAGTDTATSFLERAASRVRFYRFFLLPPLYLALLAFAATAWDFRKLWVAGVVAIFAIGTNFYPYFYSHYIAAIACLFVLISVAGLDRISQLKVRGQAAGADACLLLVALCLAHFLFWYGLHLFGSPEATSPIVAYETWDAINQGDPESRLAINRQLLCTAGQHLVFVRYGPQHMFAEWVHNGANLEAARIVWARDLGPTEDEKLRRYYRDRTAWLLEADAKPPKLTRL